MKFKASVSGTITEDVGHRAVIRLEAINGTGSPLVFDIQEATGPFRDLVALVGGTRYIDASNTAFEHHDRQPLGSIELDDDHINKLRHYRVAM